MSTQQNPGHGGTGAGVTIQAQPGTVPGGGRFDYVAYDAQAQAAQVEAKVKMIEVEGLILKLGHSRATSLAFTKLEEVYMWIGKAIRDDQVKRNQGAPLQEARGNE